MPSCLLCLVFRFSHTQHWANAVLSSEPFVSLSAYTCVVITNLFVYSSTIKIESLLEFQCLGTGRAVINEEHIRLWPFCYSSWSVNFSGCYWYALAVIQQLNCLLNAAILSDFVAFTPDPETWHCHYCFGKQRMIVSVLGTFIRVSIHTAPELCSQRF